MENYSKFIANRFDNCSIRPICLKVLLFRPLFLTVPVMLPPIPCTLSSAIFEHGVPTTIRLVEDSSRHHSVQKSIVYLFSCQFKQNKLILTHWTGFLVSVLLEALTKWKTMFRISVSKPFASIACSNVRFMSILSTSGVQTNFYRRDKRKFCIIIQCVREICAE